MIKKYYDKLSAYPRLRILLIFLALVFVLIVLMRTFSSHQVQRTVVPPSNIPATPVNPTRAHKVGEAAYDQLQEIQKREVLQKAESSGSSYFENNLLQGGAPVVDKPKAEAKPAAHPKPTIPVQKPVSPEDFYHQRAAAPVAQAPEAVVPEGLTPEQMAQAIQAQESKMQSQLNQVAGSWGYPTFQTTGGGESASGGSLAPGGGEGSVTKTSVAIKAGSIFFAVLEVTLNSDQPGTPVMATVVSGKLKGAKLLGTFTRQKDKLVLQFHTMTMASRPSSIGINAYAIDPDTAQNALASDVNNHYLLRYGSLFAAAFLEGFGNAWSSVQSPDQQANGLINVYTAPPVQATTKTAMYQGLGQVGTNLGQAVSQTFNTPPTVTLNAGTGVGILFMSDLSL